MPTRGPRDMEASAGSPCRRSPPTLLPGPVAHAVSLATRSTSLAIRLGSFVSYCGLDAARITTLSSLGLARGFVETILGRAAHDTMTESSSDLTTTEVEKIFERSLESLHSVVTQIVFWTSAGFRFTGTSISSASEASQLLLGSLDKLFGSTDSSRAVASIITLVRRELNNPASGEGEKVGVSDLAVALGVLAYLQGASRRSAVEEARRKSQEEVIWDVVVLSDGERIDVGYGQAEAEQRRQNEFGGPCAPNGDDEATMERLKDHISSNLDPGTTVSISNSMSSVQTITVDVSGPQLLSLPTPPGAEIVETRGPAERSGKRTSWTLGMDGETSYTVVYRIRRDKMRNTILRGEEDKTGLTVVEMVDDATTAIGDSTAPTKPLTPIKPMESKSSSCESTQARGLPSHAPVSTSEPTANQKKQRTPPTEPPRPPTRDSAGPTSVNRQQTFTGSSKRYSPGKKREVPAAAKTTEKQPRLKRALKESGQSLSSMWNKEPSYAEPRTPAKQRPHWKGIGGVAASEVASRSKPLTSRPSQPQQPPRQSPSSRRDQTPGSSSRASSRASYVSVHERRRDSVVSQTDSFPRRSKSDTQLSTPTMIRAEFSTQETLSRPSGDSCSPRSPRKTGSYHSQHSQHSQQQQQQQQHYNHNNRSSASYAPSLYSLATNDSQSSLISASYYQKSAYNTSAALNVLRNEGFVDGTFPAGHLLPNIARYMRYSSACYGSHFMKLLGISTELPASQVWDGTHPDVRHFAHHTESKHGNILLASFVDPQGGSDATGSTGTGVPLVHYISLDHEAKAVVFACRGTLGFEDVLADLTCDYDDLLWRGRAYRVHKGVHASAKRLLFGGDGRVLVTLKEALLEFPEYGLVLCGHSLGGGVTSLLGVMLSEPNATGPGFVISAEPSTAKHPHYQGQQQQQQHRFGNAYLPHGRRIHVYAYGPPGIMSPSLRKLTRGLITTVVHGSDIVPYLSLGVLHDFQFLALAFKKDDHGTKAEIRHRMWRAFQGHLAEKWHQDSRYPAAPREGDEEWVLPMLQALRGTMKGKRLLPPGEVFVVETTRVLRRDAFVVQEESGGTGGIGRPARRVVLKYIRDVEGRFMELRFAGGMVTDHSPARYEDALNRLRVGVVE